MKNIDIENNSLRSFFNFLTKPDKLAIKHVKS